MNKVSKINKINRIYKINRIKSSELKFYCMCTFLGIISVACILKNRKQNYLFFFFSCILRKQKKTKACVLILHEDVLIFSLLKDTKSDKIKTTLCKVAQHGKFILQKESLCLIHRILLLLSVAFPPTFCSQYTTKKNR